LPARYYRWIGRAQAKKVATRNGGRLEDGSVRAWRNHIYADFQKGDLAAAALMAKVLERVGKAEGIWRRSRLSKTIMACSKRSNKAMDDFISLDPDAKAKHRIPPGKSCI